MSLKYWAFCLLLFLVVIFLAGKSYETWTRPIELLPEKGASKKSGVKVEAPSAIGTVREPIPPQSYISIAEKNIFSPERKDFPVPEGQKPIVRPQVILYGVTIVGDYHSASIASPGRILRKGERETMTVKIGERIGQYKLAKISSDRITLEAPGDTYDVLLYDPTMPKKRMDVKTETKPVTITSTSPAPLPSSPGSPTAPGTAGIPATVRTPTTTGAPATIAPKDPAQTTPTLPAPVYTPPAYRRGTIRSYPQPGTPEQKPGGN